MFDKAAPVPVQQTVQHKKTLQLVVQLLKRWRDLYYQDTDLAPISILLTTLAGHAYAGERSVAKALGAVLDGTIAFIDHARTGGTPLRVWHPTNPAEELSERWAKNRAAYEAFEAGIRDFHRQWTTLVARNGNVNAELEKLFGQPVKAVLMKRAQQRREAGAAGKLGVTSSGLITSAVASAVPLRPHTFYGEE